MARTRVVAVGALIAALAAIGATVRPTPTAPSGRSGTPEVIDRPLDAKGGERPRRERRGERPAAEEAPRIAWRESTALGAPEAGSLKDGVLLPRSGRTYFTWDPVRRVGPSPAWRRWATDDLLRTILGVLRDFARAHPGAPRVGIGDLSLEGGGYFGAEVGGGIGHATHQNGLDADVYYPLRSERERPPAAVGEIDLPLAQELVDRFVQAGAVIIYVGPNTPLTGPAGVVIPLVHHDNHLHLRIAPI